MLKSLIRNMLVFGTILILIVSGFLFDGKFNDELEGTNIGLELPVYTINNQSCNNETLKFPIQNLKSPRGTRGAPADWSSIGWVQLAPGESFSDGNNSFDFEIYDIFANDSMWDLYLKIQVEMLNPPMVNMTYDFYFNVSSTVWYRTRLYRRGLTNWSFYISYNYTAGVPNDNSVWTNELSYFNIKTDVFNYNYSGFEYDCIDSVYFWINKTKLSQGYSSLYYPSNFTLFADVHDYNRSQNGISDRAPDFGCVWYEPRSLMIKDQIIEQKWSTEGNSVGDEDVFGTLNEQDLRIITNGDQRMVITADGKVGIGMTSPSTKLHVNGVITASGGTSINWNTAYGWGDHASAGYLSSETDPTVTLGKLQTLASNDFHNLGGTDNVLSETEVDNYVANNGYLTSYSETDPVFGGSVAYGIASSDIINWNTAYGWGDHASAGYLSSETDPTVTLGKLQTLASNDFHNLGGTDNVLSETEVDNYVANNGYLTSYSETDPVFGGSVAYGIASSDITNWNTAYSWGDHSSAGYDSTDDPWVGTGNVYITSGKVGIGTTSPDYNLTIGDGISERLHFSGSINPENPPAGSVVIYFDGYNLYVKNSGGKVKSLAKF